MKIGKREITKAYDLWMESHGFNKVSDNPNRLVTKYYSKKLINDKTLIIIFDLDKERGHWVPPRRLEGKIYFNKLDNIVAKYLKPDTLYNHPIKGYPLSLNTPINEKLRFNINSLEDLNCSLELIEEHYQDFIVPFENHFQDINDLYHYVENIWKIDNLTSWMNFSNGKTCIIRLVYKALLKTPDFYTHIEEIPKYFDHLKEIGRDGQIDAINEIYPAILDELIEIYKNKTRHRMEFIFIPGIVFYDNIERGRQRVKLLTESQKKNITEYDKSYSEYWEKDRPMKDGLPLCMYNQIFDKLNRFDRVGCEKLNEE